MAGSVAGVMGWGVSDGESIDATGTRWSSASRVDSAGGAGTLTTRGGIIPAGGNPLQVQAQGTPARSIVLKAGSVFVPGNSTTVPPAGVLTLTSDQTLATDPEHATLPRIDLVIAKIVNTGTSSSTGTFEILTGTANASPSRPTLPTGTSHCVSLGTILVQPTTVRSVIQSADISLAQSDTWTNDTSDAFWMASPGGTVLGPLNIAGTAGNLMAMSATRRQAWAALWAPGTRWVDTVARVEGYISGGDIVPTTPRVVSDTNNAAAVFTDTSTPSTSVTVSIGALPGGTRRIAVDAFGHLSTNAGAGAFVSARAFLDGSGITGAIPAANVLTEWQEYLTGNATQALTRVTVGGHITGTASGAISLTLKVLREGGSAGSGTGQYAYLTNGRLIVWDMGPA